MAVALQQGMKSTLLSFILVLLASCAAESGPLEDFESCDNCDIVEEGAIGDSCLEHADCGAQTYCHPVLQMCTVPCQGACPGGAGTVCVQEPSVEAPPTNPSANDRWDNPQGGVCMLKVTPVGCSELPNFVGDWKTVEVLDAGCTNTGGGACFRDIITTYWKNTVEETVVPRWDTSESPQEFAVCLPTTNSRSVKSTEYF